MNIGSQLQLQRKKLNYTQEEVAEKIHVSRQTISSWENSRSLPDVMSVILMSDVYGLSLDNLLKGDRKMIEKIEAEENLRKASKWISGISFGISGIVVIMSFIFELGEAINLNVRWIASLLVLVLGVLNLASISIFENYKRQIQKSKHKEISTKKVVFIVLGLILIGLISGFLFAYYS
ncbi:helix-turn-helix domain-containing protein [Enterococcus sp. AZ196]|uniref:helix-turn-helix domain-containing protein n=1 Tax=Enterococcus sp. AZ196 TaxID=2774659 RepID=UPI003D2D762F